MYILSIYNLVTTNKDIYCSDFDEWLVYSPVLNFSSEYDSNERNLDTNKVCRLNIKFGFETLNDILAEYNLHNRHISIKKYIRKWDEHERFIEEFDRPVIIGINTAEEIPLGVSIDFILDQEKIYIYYDHNSLYEKFKTILTWDIKSSGHFDEVLNNLKNLLLENPKDKLEDIAIQFIIELRKIGSEKSLDANLKTLTTGLFSFVVGDDNIALSLVNENDYYLY